MRTLTTLTVLTMLTALCPAQSHRIDAIDPPINGEYPGNRGPEQMIIYTSAYGSPTTGTNEWGIEAVVENGLVVSVGPNDSVIPENGFVISGHEESATWIGMYLHPGTPVTFDESEVHIDDSPEGRTRELIARLQIAEERLAALGASWEILEGTQDLREEAAETLQISEESAATLQDRVEPIERAVVELEMAAIPSPEGEIRGVWHRLVEFTREDITQMVEDMADTHINVMLPETIYNSAVIYSDPTGLYPLMGQLDGLDALEVLLEECHARGMEVHVWVECFFIGAPKEDGTLPGLALSHPDWLACNRDGSQQATHEPPGFMYFNPAHPEVRQALIDAYVALVENYDIDGFQFDYIRYSGADWDYSDLTREMVRAELGFDPLEITEEQNPEQWEQWLAWRENQVSSFVHEAATAMRAVRPDIVLTAAVVSDLERARRVKGQNWAAWAQAGDVDALMSMIYTYESESVIEAVEQMSDLQPEDQPTVAGLGAYMGLTPRQIVEQIEAARSAGADGSCLFAWHSVPESMREMLRLGPWRTMTTPNWD